MKILLLGKNGQLGWEISERVRSEGIHSHALDMPQFDIRERKLVEEAVRQEDYSLVINAAAYTAVDKAETELEQAFEVNCKAPGHLASCCSRNGVPLIHISTDYVFDGKKKEPYVETDPVCPLSVYGKSKAGGENEVRDRLERHIIIRTSWLYSTHGSNFVKTILRLASEREELRVVADQVGSPTYARDLASAILQIAHQIHDGRPVPWGTYHYCGKGITSWHAFAKTILDLAEKQTSLKCKRVQGISTKEYPTPAKRAHFSALDCSKIKQLFMIDTRQWENSLQEMLARMLGGPTG